MYCVETYECCTSAHAAADESVEVVALASDCTSIFSCTSEIGRFAGVRLGGPEIFFLPFNRPRFSARPEGMGGTTWPISPDSQLKTSASDFDTLEGLGESSLALVIRLLKPGRKMGQGRSTLWSDGKRMREAKGAG